MFKNLETTWFGIILCLTIGFFCIKSLFNIGKSGNRKTNLGYNNFRTNIVGVFLFVIGLINLLKKILGI